MIDFLVGIFWVGLVVVVVTIVMAKLDERARKRQAEQDKEGHP